ncbi:hypothetical protein EXIGLDRAFT_791258 [Exidia glandulosa HHB12029]|uniref:Uncharacterized protein n=1 Tax=Exidia glandulosa HHB12029 TaxID=1314781 RepID=A0A166MGJ0_EXIGL|nr:hypothetical protein EXIGLDRAFT_791258 [Exidia glandulosa HHB12029]
MWGTCGGPRFTDGIAPEPSRSARRPLIPFEYTDHRMRKGPGLVVRAKDKAGRIDVDVNTVMAASAARSLPLQQTVPIFVLARHLSSSAHIAVALLSHSLAPGSTDTSNSYRSRYDDLRTHAFAGSDQRSTSADQHLPSSLRLSPVYRTVPPFVLSGRCGTEKRIRVLIQLPATSRQAVEDSVPSGAIIDLALAG